MEKKYLGKIESAEFGNVRGYEFMFGLKLSFKFDNGGVSDGGRYTVNVNPDCKWEENELDRSKEFERILDLTANLIQEAKVSNVSELKNKPVEITIEGQTFKDFRILTEVL